MYGPTKLIVGYCGKKSEKGDLELKKTEHKVWLKNPKSIINQTGVEWKRALIFLKTPWEFWRDSIGEKDRGLKKK